LAVVLQRAIRSQSATADGDGETTAAEGRVSALELRVIDGNQPGALKSAILSNARITADARANSLVVTAPVESMDLIADLIEQLDRAPDVEAEIKVFSMRNGDAVSLVQTLNALFGTTEGGEQAPGGFGGENPLVQLQFSVDERTNSIIAVGSKSDLEVVYAILLQLDSGEVRERVTTVYRLKNASAEAVALALNNWLQSERQVEQTAELAISPFEQIEREVIIVPELGSNSLIVSATPRYYKEISDLIDRLDERPPMVMIQVLIAEVTLNDTDEFGVELGLQDSLLFDRSLVDTNSFLTTTTTTQTQSQGGATIATVTEQNVVNAQLNPGFNFNNAPIGNNGSSNVVANSGAVGAQGLSNFALGRVNDALGFGGFVFAASSSSVNVLLRALQEDRRLEVLSRPQIVALDGQPGYVLVGQRVPRIANTTINLGVQSNEVVYEDVGLILQVRPRVSPGPDGLVVMEIQAQKSQLGPLEDGIPISIAPGGDVVRSPIIDTTEAVTTVSALSGQTIVLSGLLTKNSSSVHRRVPLISDIPLIGDFFRYDSVSERRTELLIILTPRVTYNEADVEMLKQVESSRMSWVLGDVIEMHGDANLRSRCDYWGEEDAPGVYPTYIPTNGELLPPGSEPVPLKQPGSLPPTPPQESKRRLMPQLPSLKKAAAKFRHSDDIRQAQYDAETAPGADPVRLPPL
jgi:type II secretion system protein D